MIRAKFKVNSVTISGYTRYEDGKAIPIEVRTVNFTPVCDGSEENKKFWTATPNGRIELGCALAETAAQFEYNKEYYVDFTPAEDNA